MLSIEEIRDSVLVDILGDVYQFVEFCETTRQITRDMVPACKLRKLSSDKIVVQTLQHVQYHYVNVEHFMDEREIFTYRLSGKLPENKFKGGELTPSGERCG